MRYLCEYIASLTRHNHSSIKKIAGHELTENYSNRYRGGSWERGRCLLSSWWRCSRRHWKLTSQPFHTWHLCTVHIWRCICLYLSWLLKIHKLSRGYLYSLSLSHPFIVFINPEVKEILWISPRTSHWSRYICPDAYTLPLLHLSML